VAVVLVYLAHLVYLVYMAYMVYLANVCRPHLTSGIDEDAMQKAASCKFPAATRRLVALKGSTYAHTGCHESVGSQRALAMPMITLAEPIR